MKFKSLENHMSDCFKIQRSLIENKDFLSINKTNTSNSHLTRNKQYKKHLKLIDTTSFHSIITIDKDKKLALVEPGVTMEELVDACLKYNLIPSVTPEFKTITVGGAIMGAALESSSHKWGQFNNICTKYKILLGNGNIVEASSNQNEDLFYAVSGSYGSLGILLLVEIQLEESNDFVELTFRKFSTSISFAKALNNTLIENKKPDFLEAIIYSENEYLIIEGSKKDKQGLNSSSKVISLSFCSHWFYKIIQQRKNLQPLALNIKDYLFRFDKGAFWMAHYLSSFKWLLYYLFKRKKFETANIPFKSSKLFDRLISFFLGSFLSSSSLYKKLRSLSETWFKNTFVVQDLYIPIESLNAFVNEVEKFSGIYPLWICPVKTTKKPELFSPHFIKTTEYVVDVGIYGATKRGLNSIKTTQYLEKKLKEMRGKKMFYAHTYYSLESIQEIYDFEKYQEIRKKYYAENIFLPIDKKIL